TALRNRFTSFLAGMGATALLQSSTATALMTTTFAAGGLVALVPALSIMLGANVGTTPIVQVLSFNVSAVPPLFFLAGFLCFTWGKTTWVSDLGRVVIGLGLMLIALHVLLDTLAPAEDAPSVRALLAAATGEPLLCVLIAGVLTWAAHSSAAIVLLVMSLAYSHFITPLATLALVLGANLGAAVNPILEGGSAGNPATRRVPIGNLFNRVVGTALVLPLLPKLVSMFVDFEPNPARMAADFHTAFNVVLALGFMFVLDPLAAALTRLFPESKQSTDMSAPL